MKSEADNIEDYIDSFPAEREAIMRSMHTLIMENLPKGYEAVMNWGMITYQIPLSVFADTYNGKPLMYAALAAQKNHLSLYLSCMYSDEQTRISFEGEFAESGKRLDAGKSCVRFKKLEDLPLNLIARAIAAYPVEDFIKLYIRVRENNLKGKTKAGNSLKT